MDCGFICTANGESTQFEILGEERCADPALISWARRGHVSAAVMGRLYYVAELAGTVGMSAASLAAMSAAEVAVAAYAALGRNAFRALDGDFALALHDRRRDVLFAYRDPMGGFPLFWTQDAGALQVSTSLRTLRQRLPSAKLNREYLAAYLMSPTPFEQEVPAEETIAEGVWRILPGVLTSFDAAQRQSARETLCDWAEAASETSDLAYPDIVVRYRELLTAAVEERMRGRIGAHFSGGMDSTSVALLLHQRLLRQGDPLRTYTLTYKDLPGQRQEAPFIAAARAAAPAAIHASLPGDAWYDFEDFGARLYQDEPCGTPWQSTMSLRTTARAADDGVDTLFTGLGGEEFVALSPYHIADLLKQGRVAAAFADAGRLGAFARRSRWYYLWTRGLARLLPWHALAWLRPMRRPPWPEQTDQSLPPWIDPDFARRHRFKERLAAQSRDMAFGGKTPTLSLQLFALRYRPGDALRWTLGASRGVFIAHPYKDVRLIRFALGVFPQLPAIVERQKPLLGDAMIGLLPEAIRLRPDKGHATENVFRGLARNLSTLERIAAESEIDALGFVDRSSLLDCLRQAAAGINSEAMKRLLLTLFLAKWVALDKNLGAQRLSRRLLFDDAAVAGVAAAASRR